MMKINDTSALGFRELSSVSSPRYSRSFCVGKDLESQPYLWTWPVSFLARITNWDVDLHDM